MSKIKYTPFYPASVAPEDKMLQDIFGASKDIRKPDAYLLTPKFELIDIPFFGHSTAIISNPILSKYIPWAEQARKTLELHAKHAPDWRTASGANYAHRTALTTPLDTTIFDTFYAIGGYRLVCYTPYSEQVIEWELTGANPYPLREHLSHWLEHEEPSLPGTPRLTTNFTIRLQNIPIMASFHEYPECLKLVEAKYHNY